MLVYQRVSEKLNSWIVRTHTHEKHDKENLVITSEKVY